MKKLLIAVSFMALGAPAYALELSPRLGVDVYNESYEEFVSGVGKVMQETARMSGVVADLGMVFASGNSLVVSGAYAKGESEYTGSYMGGTYGDVVLPDIDRTRYELATTFKMPLRSMGGLVLGAGAAYRYLEDRLDKYEGGYRRENEGLYAVVGVEYPALIGDRWSITPSVQYRHLIRGEQRSHLGGVTMINTQRRGFGVNLSVAVGVRLGGAVVEVTPYLRSLEIERSDVSMGGYEPENTTAESGVAVALRF